MFNTVTPVRMSADQERAAREKVEQTKKETETAIPAGNLGTGDNNLQGDRTADEKKVRLRVLNDLYNAAMNKGMDGQKAFEASQEYQEYLSLRKAVFGKLPSYIK
jgi:hypothetical protein